MGILRILGVLRILWVLRILLIRILIIWILIGRILARVVVVIRIVIGTIRICRIKPLRAIRIVVSPTRRHQETCYNQRNRKKLFHTPSYNFPMQNASRQGGGEQYLSQLTPQPSLINCPRFLCQPSTHSDGFCHFFKYQINGRGQGANLRTLLEA